MKDYKLRNPMKQQRWKPENNFPFYSIFFSNEGEHKKVLKYYWFNDALCKDLYRIGNVFETRSEAQKVAKQIKELLKNR